jgi:hypothetical protein
MAHKATASAEGIANVDSPREVKSLTTRARKDKGKMHRCRHGVLSRCVVEALSHLGECPRTLRRLEREFRAALKVQDPLGDLIFDYWWASALRVMLIGRLEETAIKSLCAGSMPVSALPPLPPLILQQDLNSIRTMETSSGDVQPDVFRALALAQRYHAHHGRILERILALLVVLSQGGETALVDSIKNLLGMKNPDLRGSQ